MVAAWKIKEVKSLADRISESRVIGLVSISGIPSRQLQRMRKGLMKKAELRVTKNSIMKRAFEKAELDLGGYVEGSMGVVFTDIDPFRLSRLMMSTKTSAPAKPGSIAIRDIVIPAGDTPFKPGPIIGELQKVGIKAKIEGGRIVVTEDSLVVECGGVISADLANILARLGIEPMEMGLEIKAAYEDKMVFTGDVLNMDDERTIADIQNAYNQSLNLALNAGIYNPTTIIMFLRRAFYDTFSLATKSGIVNRETINPILSTANMQMLSLASKVPDALDNELRGLISSVSETKTDPKVETTGEKNEKSERHGKSGDEDATSGLASLFG